MENEGHLYIYTVYGHVVNECKVFQPPDFTCWMTTRYEPWQPEFAKITLTVEEAGLKSSIFHMGRPLFPDSNTFFNRASEEQSGELLPFSLEVLLIPFALLLSGLALAVLEFVWEAMVGRCKGFTS